MRHSMHRVLLLLTCLFTLVACGGGGGGGGAAVAPVGNLKVAMSDAPACGYNNVYVTVTKVRVNQSSSAADTDPGWTDITVNSTARIDLLSLSNGILTTLGQTALPAGHYSQLELVLAANGSSAPYANAVVPTGTGTEVALTTPSGQQSGLKINADITVNANQEADFLVDFNACKSVVSAGNSGKYLLKPVLTVTPLLLSGINGYVDGTLANSSTRVSAQQNGVEIRSTAPDSNGQFVLTSLAPGNYDLVITASGRTTEVLRAVPVAATVITPVNTSATAFTLPTSTDGTVTGVVTSTVSPIVADVAVEQALGSGGNIEVADMPVDSVTGAYSYSLPLAHPLVGTYVAVPGIPGFVADTGTAGAYTLTANSNGVSKPAPTVTLSATVATSVNFSF